MRQLATIQKIEEIQPIEGADLIEKLRINGWWVVSQKGTFEVGSLCIYFEIDSLLPDIPQFSFLSKGSSLKKSITEDNKEVEGYRLKTIRLRDQVSQGLALPLSEFPEITYTEVGMDITEILNVYKYEPPIPVNMAGIIEGIFPSFIPKTDEERIQNIRRLEKYNGQRFYVTSKIDGGSSTIYNYENEFSVCSRNLRLKENYDNILWKMVKKYNLKEKLPEGYAIQSELAGEGVQKNRQRIKGVDLFVYYIFDIVNYKYLMLDDMKKFVNELGMKMVPIVDENFILNHSCDELLEMANDKSPLNQDMIQEGLVFKLYDSTEKISFKAISNKYLLKYNL